jgi:hypothetical protein
MLTRMAQRLTDLGLRWEFTEITQGARHVARVRYPGVEVTFEGWNYDTYANDRAQTIKVNQVPARTSPCLIPFTDVYIDHDGSMTPCCNIRSDEPSHQGYVVGKLTTGTSIFTAYAGRRLAGWRRALLPYGEKAAPCSTCGFAILPDTSEMRDNFSRIAAGFGVASPA